MSSSIIDNPLILQMLFYPRADQPGNSRLPNVHDATIPADGAEIGCRLYVRRPDSSLLVMFHGNGEIASDYDGLATLYNEAGVSLLVVDYRGYGWSTGKPLISTLLPDADAVLNGIPRVLAGAGVQTDTWLIKGRSLGSVPAVHLAQQHPDRWRGLILESALADLPSVYRRLGQAAEALTGVELPFKNAEKMRDVHLPLLVIHGENDTLLPPENGQRLYDAAPTENKTIHRIPNAGHNDLLFVAGQNYFNILGDFVRAMM